jgi:thymidylate synthase (FAD)
MQDRLIDQDSLNGMESMTMLKVTLISYTPEPEKTVAAAAKLCYSPVSIGEIRDGLTEEKTAAFVDMLSEIGHESPIEHASFTFGIEGVSRSLLAQITRHRLASYSVQSQRYVSEAMFEFVLPPEIEGIPEAKEEFFRAMEEDQRHYDRLTALLTEKHTQDNLSAGMDEKTARRLASKKAIEDARFVLPNACATKMVCTMNARSLMNFFAHRCCNRAQWEIRALAVEMLRLVLEAAPNLFKNAGPSCLRGACPEGKMSCGKRDEVRAMFAGLKESQK